MAYHNHRYGTHDTGNNVGLRKLNPTYGTLFKSWTGFLGFLGVFILVVGFGMGCTHAAESISPPKAPAAGVVAAHPANRPTLKVEKDGLPGGHDTPEGAACDLARAFINHDVKLFRGTVIAPFNGGENRKAYETFLKEKEDEIATEATKKQPSPGGPKVIGKVFAARHLSHDGPASYGYAVFGFNDVMFVDVGVFLHNGDRSLNRTLVINNKGKWYVLPYPDASPLLSVGLNDELPSKIDLTEVYDLKK